MERSENKLQEEVQQQVLMLWPFRRKAKAKTKGKTKTKTKARAKTPRAKEMAKLRKEHNKPQEEAKDHKRGCKQDRSRHPAETSCQSKAAGMEARASLYIRGCL